MSEQVRTDDQAWAVFHKGDAATPDERRRALLYALNRVRQLEGRLKQLEPLGEAVEGMVTRMIEQRLSEVVI